MILEDFSNRFEMFELENYIFAKKKRPLFEEAYKELCEDYYQNSPMNGTQVNYDLGVIYAGSGGNLEDFVIDMIERKERFLKLLNKIRKQEELFDVAMDSLTAREKDVILVTYFKRKNNLGLSLDFFNEVLTEAQNKLCSYIGGERLKQREEAENQRKIQFQTNINKWKAWREIS